MVRAYRPLAMAAPRRGLVRKVADACGYSDPAHFCRVFRRHLGLTPGDIAQLDRPEAAEGDPSGCSLGPEAPRFARAYL